MKLAYTKHSIFIVIAMVITSLPMYNKINIFTINMGTAKI